MVGVIVMDRRRPTSIPAASTPPSVPSAGRRRQGGAVGMQGGRRPLGGSRSGRWGRRKWPWLGCVVMVWLNANATNSLGVTP